MNRLHLWHWLRALRGLPAQLLLFIILPLFLALSAIAFASVIAHQRSMRGLVGERDLRAVHVAAEALSEPGALDKEGFVQELLRSFEADSGTQVLLVDAQRRIRYATDPVLVGQTSDHPGIVEALAGDSGLLYRSDEPGGEEHVVAFSAVPVSLGNGEQAVWALVAEEPWSQVLSPWLRTSLLGPLILIPAVAAALIALWFGVQRVIRPLQRLDAQVTALGWGNFGAVETPVGGIQEIEELQRALVRMAAQVRGYQQSMRGYLAAVTEAQEDERKRLARELHDQTIQDLIALNQRVQMARRKVGNGAGDTDARLVVFQEMIESTMAEVRRFSRALRPIYLEEAGLVPALEALARDLAHAAGDDLRVTVDVTGEPRRLPPETELALYRIVQEALHNAVRHAQASDVRVGVFFDEGVVVQIQDDGVGFVAPERVSDLAEAGHYGLMGMHERAQLVGAHLVISSRPGAGPGSGTMVEVHLHPGKPSG